MVIPIKFHDQPLLPQNQPVLVSSSFLWGEGVENWVRLIPFVGKA